MRDALAIDNADDDSYIQRLIRESTSIVESRYDIAVLTQTWVLYMTHWQQAPYYKVNGGLCAIELPKSSFGSISSVQYIDTDGTTQTWSAGASGYKVVDHGKRVRIRPSYGESWPSLRTEHNAVAITWTAGAASYKDVPFQVQQAIRSLVVFRFESECMPEDKWWHGLDMIMIGEEGRQYL